ncbi:MAG: hypothetical protein KC419_18170 [Anaerolineales bacterium]|nr:hypothetical protein [Anaerolineales bacterium]MCA9930418.1 hypothetical protein [Anaerolineales bacterium]
MPQFIRLDSRNRYEIQIQGCFDASWLDWFDTADLTVEIIDAQTPITRLSNIVTDQVGLVGLLRRLHGLGVVLVSVRTEAA